MMFQCQLFSYSILSILVNRHRVFPFIGRFILSTPISLMHLFTDLIEHRPWTVLTHRSMIGQSSIHSVTHTHFSLTFWIMSKRRIINRWSLVFDNWTILQLVLLCSMNAWCSLQITNFVFTLRRVSISMRTVKNGSQTGWKSDRRRIIFKHNVFPHIFNQLCQCIYHSLLLLI